jgi:hypothetical protein
MLFWHDLCPGSVYLEPLCYYTKISCSTLVWADPWGSVLLSRKTVCLQNPRMLSVSLLNYRKSTLYMLYLSVSLSNFHFSTLIHLYIFIYIFSPSHLFVIYLFVCSYLHVMDSYLITVRVLIRSKSKRVTTLLQFIFILSFFTFPFSPHPSILPKFFFVGFPEI